MTAPDPTCHTCATPLAWNTAVFFDLATPVVVALNRPGSIVQRHDQHVIVCAPCAALVLRRNVQGILDRSGLQWAEDGARSEAAALTLRFLNAVGPALDFGEWWTLHHA